MCGRFPQSKGINRYMKRLAREKYKEVEDVLPPTWNLAPSRPAWVIRGVGGELVALQQRTVYLFAGIADRASYPEIRNDAALPPSKDGACLNLEVVPERDDSNQARLCPIANKPRPPSSKAQVEGSGAAAMTISPLPVSTPESSVREMPLRSI
jgi:hypothetical protein